MTLSTDVPSPGRAAIAYNLAGLALLVLLMAVGLAYLIDQANRAGGHAEPRLGDGDTVVQTIAGRELTIPNTWLRYGEQIREGFASQVDLDVRLDLFDGEAPQRVEVSLLSATRARASSTLLDRVYLHQFADGVRDGIAGLVGKPLEPREGYAGETVWYDALSPQPFVAKCMASLEQGTPERCLRTVHLSSGLAAVISFDATALGAWKSFDTELARWLEQIGAL
jgi:hypothetical protein